MAAVYLALNRAQALHHGHNRLSLFVGQWENLSLSYYTYSLSLFLSCVSFYCSVSFCNRNFVFKLLSSAHKISMNLKRLHVILSYG